MVKRRRRNTLLTKSSILIEDFPGNKWLKIELITLPFDEICFLSFLFHFQEIYLNNIKELKTKK